ncbi:nucleoside recognition domain-containing protein [uncultured Agrobacterium sp.]|uniref:nucleoside recognition domain-containing protein n=1 Tax=uncultured Agrobacterium sp. TaxID=157277 RepID=UPI0025D76A5D|nr:nucleoside recognition domain-containing protein [uncultured Agrobacterium sp.]
MSFFQSLLLKSRETLAIYWLLVKITVPISLLTEVLSRLGVVEAVAPAFGPVMNAVGLPPELGLAWLTAMLVGVWGAVPLLFTLVPMSELSTADVTVFSALVLFAHGLPLEQKIIQKAGPGMVATTMLRILGGFIYALILHRLFQMTGWLSAPVAPAWVPGAVTPDWSIYLLGLAETMIMMLVVLLLLSWSLEVLKVTGVLGVMMKGIEPLLGLAGIKGEAGHLTAIGLFLGISYGAGLLIREARSGIIAPRQIFLSCVFMGFAHSIIEDTLLMVSLGADIYSTLIGRVIFAIGATAALALVLAAISDRAFFSRLFRSQPEGV